MTSQGEKINPAKLHGRAQSLPEPTRETTKPSGGFANFGAMPMQSGPPQAKGSTRLGNKSASDFADFSAARTSASSTSAFPQRQRPTTGVAVCVCMYVHICVYAGLCVEVLMWVEGGQCVCVYVCICVYVGLRV